MQQNPNRYREQQPTLMDDGTDIAFQLKSDHLADVHEAVIDAYTRKSTKEVEIALAQASYVRSAGLFLDSWRSHEEG